MGFAGNRGSISSPVFWKLGPNFRRNCGPGGVVGNVGSTSRRADRVCKSKGCHTLCTHPVLRYPSHLMPGILEGMACGVALDLAMGGGAMCRRPAPGGKTRLFFEECSMCVKIANTVKNGPWDGLVWGKGRNQQKAKHQEEIDAQPYCFSLFQPIRDPPKTSKWLSRASVCQTEAQLTIS